MRLASTILRVWQLERFLGACVLFGIVLRAFPEPVDVPGRQGGVEWVLHPIAPLLLASMLPSSLARCGEYMEVLSGKFGPRGRTIIILGASATLLGATTAMTGVFIWQSARNSALSIGLACVCSIILPATMRWVPLVVLAITVWLLGVPPPGDAPPMWAVVLSPGTSVFAAAVCVTVAAVGIGWYIARS